MESLADWQPEQYLRFRDERTQPTVDLARRIDAPPPRRVLDVGCGPGNSTAVLRALWPEAEIIGLDSSESMLEKARKISSDITWVRRDASLDMRDLGTFDVIFSNAAFQWIPGTEELIPRLFDMLSPAGVMAVQAPYVRELPVYAAAGRLTALPEWEPYFAEPVIYPLHRPCRFYYDILCGLEGHISMWQTDYIHIMNSCEDIVEWYKGSGLRPFLGRLPDDDTRRDFLAAYTEQVRQAYPVERDGKVLLPFTRGFFLLYKGNNPKPRAA